jgi:hypothetical protein
MVESVQLSLSISLNSRSYVSLPKYKDPHRGSVAATGLLFPEGYFMGWYEVPLVLFARQMLRISSTGFRHSVSWITEHYVAGYLYHMFQDSCVL